MGLPRHKRMTLEDKRQKVARQFSRRLGPTHDNRGMKARLGTKDYWYIYEARLKEQGGKCAICGKTEPGGRGKRFHLDHDKKTGVIRGLLCCGCNLRLGFVEEHLNTIAKYLRGWRPR